MNRPLRLIIAALLCIRALSSQGMVCDTISCVDIAADTIIFNGADWSPLFDVLSTLQDSTATENNVISIVHLGDSHVQAGYFTEALRIPMQQKWGNAGRGLITPLKLCKTNEPSDYSITTPDKWNFKRCIAGKHFSSDVGVSGISILPHTKYIDLTFQTMSRHGEEVGFNTLRLFHAPTDRFPQLLPHITPDGLNTFSVHAGETYFTWSDTLSSIRLEGAHSYEVTDAAIYGASLENGKSGVIIHTIGNNSATYDSYNNVEGYARKLSVLEPQLIIISLGTNESIASTTTTERIYRHIDTLVSDIRKENPQALILLTTPADNKVRQGKKRRRTYAANKHLALVQEAIHSYGRDHNIAVWDWYTIGGGKGSCETWIKEKGMKPDHIHYTEKGYTLQGALLYHSILQAYEQHIR